MSSFPPDGPRPTERPPARSRFLALGRWVHRNGVFPLLATVLPADCYVCGRPLGPRHLMGACLECWASLEAVRPPFCRRCGVPLPPRTDLLGPAGGRCASCLLGRREPALARAAVVYDSRARRILLRAKFGGRPELLAVMGSQLGSLLRASGFGDGCTSVVPVPSHPWLSLRRGFNPAREIAAPVSRILGLPLRTRLLVRRLRRHRPAKRLGAPARRLVLEGAFRATRGAAGHDVLLVDDVLTSGATAEACARALTDAGASTVRLAAWARTPLRDAG